MHRFSHADRLLRESLAELPVVHVAVGIHHKDDSVALRPPQLQHVAQVVAEHLKGVRAQALEVNIP